MKIDLKSSFKSKSFKYGSYAAAMAVVFLAILIAVNLLIGQLDYKLDLTADRVYSISEDSYAVIDNLTENISIYTLYETGKEDNIVKEMLLQYARRSNYITVENKDPYLFPQFTQKYMSTDEGEIAPGSVIVESSETFKVISPSELYTYAIDYSTYSSTLQSIDVEPKVTNAINYVTGASSCNVYYTQGHNETALTEGILRLLIDENMTYSPVNLMTEDMPDDIDILVSIAPQKDFTIEETGKIRDFLDNNGRAFFIGNISLEEKTNFNSILNSYGIEFNNAFVVENDSSRLLTTQNKVAILPNLIAHDITNPLISRSYPVLLLFAQGINKLDVVKSSIVIEPLLSTSPSSYVKVNLETETVEREAGDIDGPFDVAVAVTDTDPNGARLVAVSTSYLIDSSVNETVSGANGDFLLNSLHWLLGSTDKISIRPKSITQEYLAINESQIIIIALITIIIIPLAIIIAGIVIWLRRKHK